VVNQIQGRVNVPLIVCVGSGCNVLSLWGRLVNDSEANKEK